MRHKRRPRADYVPYISSDDALGEADRFADAFRRGEVGDQAEVARVRARSRKLHADNEAAFAKVQELLPVKFVIDTRPAVGRKGWTAYVPFLEIEIDGPTEGAVEREALEEIKREIRINPTRVLEMLKAGDRARRRMLSIHRF